MNDKIRKRYNYWIEIGEYDLETARTMLRTGRLLYVGFMCQQSIEKMLKAYHWKAHGTEPPFLHNLSKLSDQSGLADQMDAEQRELLDRIDPMYIQSRYPDERRELAAGLTKEGCSRMLSGTEELTAWIKTK